MTLHLRELGNNPNKLWLFFILDKQLPFTTLQKLNLIKTFSLQYWPLLLFYFINYWPDIKQKPTICMKDQFLKQTSWAKKQTHTKKDKK